MEQRGGFFRHVKRAAPYLIGEHNPRSPPCRCRSLRAARPTTAAGHGRKLRGCDLEGEKPTCAGKIK